MDCEQRCSSEGNSSARPSTLIRWNASAMRCHQFCAGIRTRFFGVGSGVGLDCIFVHFLASRRKGILPFKSLIKKEFAAACKGLLHSAKVPLDGFLNRRSEVRISPGHYMFCFVTQAISVAVLPEWRQVQRERRSPLPVPFPLTCRPLGRRSDSNMQVGRPFLLCAPRSERNGEDYVEEFAA